MGRSNKMPIGTLIHGWEVTDTPPKYKGTNRLLLVRCATCGTTREAWNTSLRQDKVKCSVCNTRAKQIQRTLEEDLPFIAVYPDRVEIIYDFSLPLVGNPTTYRMVTGDLALPAVFQVAQADAVPEPDQGYTYHLVVPAEWVDFYCDLGGLAESQEQEALDYYYDLVHVPDNSTFLSPNLKGSGQTWSIGGKLFAYIYWMDHNTWPKSYPAPEARTTLTPATHVAPRPEPAFPSLQTVETPLNAFPSLE